MKFLKRTALFWFCAAIGIIMSGTTGCRTKVSATAVYYTVTLKVAGAEGGTVKALINGKPVETGSETNIPVLSGTKIKITAHPLEGFNISSWTGATASNAAAELTVTKDSSVSVLFVKKEYAVTFKVKDDTGGTLNATVDGKPISSGSKVPYGTKISFTAAPNTAENYTVNAWTGISAAAGSATAELIVTKDSTVTVEFIKRPSGGGSTDPSTPNPPQPQNPPEAVQEYTVMFSVKDNIGGTLTATAGGTTLSNGNKVPYGTKVSFTATPKTADDYTVGAWTGIDAANGTGTVELIITQDVTVAVAFEKITRQGTITFDTSEGGSVSAKVKIGETTKDLQSGEAAPHGSTVTFTAVPKEGYIFDRWEGLTPISTAPTATYMVTGDRYVKASFKNAALPYLAVSLVNREWAVSFLGDDSRKSELKGKVIIPEWINGCHITRILTFENCTEITEVVMPESITNTGNFRGCKKLAKIEFPSSVQIIGHCSRCENLTTMKLPESVEMIGDFDDCKNLQTINIPNNKKLHHIGNFRKCKKLEKLYLPENIRTIGEYAFSGCTSLELYFPKDTKNITHIAMHALGENSSESIKKLYIPKSIPYQEKQRIKALIGGGTSIGYY